MLVAKKEFKSVIKRLSRAGQYGLDTETTGLRWKDRLFSIIFSDENQAYYFNFNDKPDHLGVCAPAEFTLPRSWIEELGPIVENADSLFFLHNAKFDLGMLSKDGLEVLGTVHDTEVVERVLKNDMFRANLAAVAAKYKLEKDPRVDEYIKEHGLIDKIPNAETGDIEENKRFDLVPFKLMGEYAQTDAIITRAIGVAQNAKVSLYDARTSATRPPLLGVVMNERRLTKTCLRIERGGIHINRQYTKDALAWTQDQVKKEQRKFKKLTGLQYEESAGVFVEAFKKFNIELPKTKTGKPCTRKEVLEELDNPVADQIRAVRKLSKLCSTYYSSFLFYADDRDMIHPTMRQVGATTLRFSYADPNLQNLPKEDDEADQAKPFLVRRCFDLPPAGDFLLCSIDWKQQEYRLMADYANERQLIDAIMAGEDVHMATAKMLGISRGQAKTLNFALLYGMGVDKLARKLGISIAEAQALKNKYFERLPAIIDFVNKVRRRGKERGYVFTWNGMPLHLPGGDPQNSFVLSNHIIQGGCAQVARIAMNQIDAYMLKNRLRTRIVSQIHDELWFYVHRSELHHVAEFQRIMENVYTGRNGIKLECDVTYSLKSFAKWDQLKEVPGAA